MKYFLIRDLEDLSVFVIGTLTEQPENSIIFFDNNFIKPRFDVYPNPTTVIEGANEEEIAEYQKSLVPQEVQLWKIRTVISLMGLKETIENVMNNLEEPTKSAALNIWNYGTAVDRNSQTVLMIQSVLQMTDVEVDNMFIQANNIIL